MNNIEKLENIKKELEDKFGNVVAEVVNSHVEEIKEYTKSHIKEYIWKLLPDLLADKDLSEYGFDAKDDFYRFIDTWAVRNKIRKDFREDLMTEIMQDLKRENQHYKKAIDVITKIIRNNNNRYNFRGYDEAKDELRILGFEI